MLYPVSRNCKSISNPTRPACRVCGNSSRSCWRSCRGRLICQGLHRFLPNESDPLPRSYAVRVKDTPGNEKVAVLVRTPTIETLRHLTRMELVRLVRSSRNLDEMAAAMTAGLVAAAGKGGASW